MELYSALERKNPKCITLVEVARHKRLSTESFHFYDILKKTKLQVKKGQINLVAGVRIG